MISAVLEKKNDEVCEAVDGAEALRGIFPICANCKTIRNDTGYWRQVEAYMRSHTEAESSLGICPECAQKTLPGNQRRQGRHHITLPTGRKPPQLM